MFEKILKETEKVNILKESSEGYVFEVDKEAFEAEKDYTLHGSRLLVIIGSKGWLVTDEECIHYKAALGEPISVQVWRKPDPPDEQGRTRIPVFPNEAPAEIFMEDLERFQKDRGMEMFDWSKFVHYWGIKDRMAQNYKMLEQSAQEIGAFVEFPYFYAGKGEAK